MKVLNVRNTTKINDFIFKTLAELLLKPIFELTFTKV